MSTVAETLSTRHPWLEAFVEAPRDQFARLLAGRADIYPFTRAESVDAARMLFGDLSPGDPAREALEAAALEWLELTRMQPISPSAPVQQRALRQIADVFEIVGTLQLKDAAEQLRRRYVRWWAWVDDLPSRAARDPRAAYLRMLANTQGALQDRFNDPDGLSPLWMRNCAEAGRTFPASYLHIGLAGLRKLPGATGRGDTPWITGLAEWALACDPAPEEFLRVWRPLKRLFPSSTAVLRRQVFSLLSQPSFKDAGIVPPGWWKADPDFPNSISRVVRSFDPPPKDLHESLIDALSKGRPFKVLKARLEHLRDVHRVYAARSGDSHFLARTFCNVGRKVIESGSDAHEERVRMAESFARETLNHHPFDIYAWSLWRDALAAGGAYESARDLGWDIIRRFPNNSPARNLLGELMVAGGEPAEAIKLLKMSAQDGVYDPATFTLLARLYSGAGDLKAAADAAFQATRLSPGNERTASLLRRIQGGNAPALEASHYKIGEKVEGIGQALGLEESIEGGRLRALRETLRLDSSALSELEAILARGDRSVYATLLGARYGLWREDEDVLPPVAAAFELALRDEDRERLDRLAERAPRLRALIHVARALFGDEESAEYIDRLLRTDDGSLASEEKVIKGRLITLVPDSATGGGSVRMLQGNRLAVIGALNDANEALAAPALLAA